MPGRKRDLWKKRPRRPASGAGLSPGAPPRGPELVSATPLGGGSQLGVVALDQGLAVLVLALVVSELADLVFRQRVEAVRDLLDVHPAVAGDRGGARLRRGSR